MVDNIPGWVTSPLRPAPTVFTATPNFSPAHAAIFASAVRSGAYRLTGVLIPHSSSPLSDPSSVDFHRSFYPPFCLSRSVSESTFEEDSPYRVGSLCTAAWKTTVTFRPTAQERRQHLPSNTREGQVAVSTSHTVGVGQIEPLSITGRF